MKINWRVRLKNKTTLVTLFAVIVSFIYTILGMFSVVPPISQDKLLQLFSVIFEILAAIGIVIDPTTAGVSDSAQALQYCVPKEDENG